MGNCSSGCYIAKTDRKKCRCKCRGEHHGKGQICKPDEAKLTTEFCKEQEHEHVDAVPEEDAQEHSIVNAAGPGYKRDQEPERGEQREAVRIVGIVALRVAVDAGTIE